MLRRVNRLIGGAARRLNRLVHSSSTVYRRISRLGRQKSETTPPPAETGAELHVENKPERDHVNLGSAGNHQPVLAEPKTVVETPNRAWTVEDFPVDPLPGKTRFHDFSIDQRVMQGIAGQDFRYCTPIQEQGLPIVLNGRDLIARAQTGTGKTAVFLIGIFCRLLQDQERPPPGHPRALIIAPTRELVLQIVKDGRALGAHTPLKMVAVYGGSDVKTQGEALRQQRFDVVAATPGRLLDYLRRGVLTLDRCTTLVLDEADRMLDMGFLPDVRRILAHLPGSEKRQTLLFSATISDDVRRLADRWCHRPVYQEAGEQSVSVEKIEQRVYLTTSEEKFTLLYNLIKGRDHGRILIFENMKSDAAALAARLRTYGIDNLLLTGDVPQTKRLSRLEAFRAGGDRIMVATDVAGRGIHVDDIVYVVNYTLPDEPENYVHRIGRTGRAGAAGVAVSFACERGAFAIPDIEAFIGRSLPCTEPGDDMLAPLPEPSIAEKKGSRRSNRPRSGRKNRQSRPGSSR